MPGSVPFDDAAVRDEIAAYLDDAWRTIIEKDVDGERATPLQIDRDRPLFGRRALTPAFFITIRPCHVIAMPLRATRVGNTQSNISIPCRTPSMR